MGQSLVNAPLRLLQREEAPVNFSFGATGGASMDTEIGTVGAVFVAGCDKQGVPFLGTVGMIGSHYTDAHVATGFGAHLARPLFREKHREDMSYAEARALLEESLRVCYYRDKNSINKFQIATVTAEGPKLSEPFALATEWSLKVHWVACAATPKRLTRAPQAYENPSRTMPGTW
jgi:hypothetical protein